MKQFILLAICMSIVLFANAQLVRSGITLHKTWSVSAEQSISGSSEYGPIKAIVGYNINTLSGNKTGFLSLFDMGTEDTVSYIQNTSLNPNVFYSVAISDAFGGSGTYIRPVVSAGYEETSPGDKDILIEYNDFESTQPFKSNNDLVISSPFNQEALFINQEYSWSTQFWSCGYSESSPGDKDFWLGQIESNGLSTYVLWDTTFGGAGEDVINSINFYEGSPVCTGYTTSFGADGKDIYVVSLNQGSGINFENTNILPGDQVLNSATDIYGNIIAVGYTDTSATGTNKDMLIVSIDGFSGIVNWTRSIGTLFDDEAFIVRQAYFSGHQNYVIGGYTTSPGGDKQNYFVMLDYWGNLVSERKFGNSSEDDCINTMFSLPDGCQFYLFGQQGTAESFTEIVALNYIFDTYNSSCNGYNNGEAYIYNANGFGAINFIDIYDSIGTWVSSNTDNYNLSPGTYYIEISYGEGGAKSGCYLTDSILISEPPLLEVTLAPTNLDCLGNLGSITATSSGGIAPYYYNWNDINSQTTATAIDLNVGNYNVVVTDDNGCTAFASQLISQSPSPSLSITSSSNISCYGANNGSATASATGGTPGYTYLWNDPGLQTSATAINLASGSYIVYATDLNGCTATSSVTITQPATSLAASTSSTNVSCKGGNDGTATVVATGGTPGYAYIWNDAGMQTTATATNLTAGTYTVTVSDLNLCTATSMVTVSEPALVTSVSITSSLNATCYGGNNGYAMATASGGTPGYSYLWNDPLSQTGAIATNLPAGIYVVNVTDLNGCTAFAMVTITQPAFDINLSVVNSSDVNCYGGNDGSATVSVIGGTPGYTFMWNDPGTQTTATAINLSAGNYLVFVTDVNGCNTSTSVTISQPSTALAVTGNIVGASCVGNDGQVQVAVSGGTPVYTYLWDDLSTNSNNYSLTAGSHFVTVTDANGCEFVGTYVIPYASSPATLRGMVSYSGGYVSAGDGLATLFVESNGTGSGQFDTLAFVNLTSAGYEFTNLLPGRYFLKIDITNPTLYPNVLNTYYNNGIVWIDADTINLNCNDLRYAHVQMQEVTLNPSGSCDISGNIVLGELGYKALEQTSGGRATGEPVPGAEILIEQEPNDIPVQTAFTNQNGDYVLTNIPIGAQYHLVVDIPGYPMLSTFVNITVNSTDTLLDNYNFILDTASGGGIFIDTASGVFVPFIESGINYLNIYPNPVSEYVVAEFELAEDNSMCIELLGETGVMVKQLFNNENCKKGKYNYRLAIPTGLAAGHYYLRIRFDKNVYVKKIILRK